MVNWNKTFSFQIKGRAKNVGLTLESVCHCLLTSVYESVHPLTAQMIRIVRSRSVMVRFRFNGS